MMINSSVENAGEKFGFYIPVLWAVRFLDKTREQLHLTPFSAF